MGDGILDFIYRSEQIISIGSIIAFESLGQQSGCCGLAVLFLNLPQLRKS